ncbi:MAG: hypothetical protein ACFB13_15235 [Kiloniellaceae bacterium]
MPKYLKLIARLANSGAIAVMLAFVLFALGKGDLGIALTLGLFTVLMGFNLYLIEKSAMLLSEEEWLKSELRKVFLRRKLRRLAQEEAGGIERV